MKELSTEEKAEAYDKAIKQIKECIPDENEFITIGMCLSNMECKDLEDAVVDSNWSKVYDYMKKKLEKQDEQKPADKVEPTFKVE